MSSFGVGVQTAGESNKDAGRPRGEKPAETLIKWIPADVLALYASILAVGAHQPPPSGNETAQEQLARIEPNDVRWFIFALLVVPVLVLLGAKQSHGQLRDVHGVALLVRALLAMTAFVLWTPLLPGSWTYGLDQVQDMGPAFPIVMGVVTAMFTGLAELILTNVEDKYKTPLKDTKDSLRKGRSAVKREPRKRSIQAPSHKKLDHSEAEPEAA